MMMDISAEISRLLDDESRSAPNEELVSRGDIISYLCKKMEKEYPSVNFNIGFTDYEMYVRFERWFKNEYPSGCGVSVETEHFPVKKQTENPPLLIKKEQKQGLPFTAEQAYIELGKLADALQSVRSDIGGLIDFFLRNGGNIDTSAIWNRFIKIKIPVDADEVEFDTETTQFSFHTFGKVWEPSDRSEEYTN